MGQNSNLFNKGVKDFGEGVSHYQIILYIHLFSPSFIVVIIILDFY